MWLRLLIGVIVIYLLYRLIKRSKGHREALNPTLGASGEDLVEDPLCRTYVPVSRSCRELIDGKTLYFCSQSCLEQYKEKCANAADTQGRREARS